MPLFSNIHAWSFRTSKDFLFSIIRKDREQDHSLPLGVSTMETLSGVSLNVDISKFMGLDIAVDIKVGIKAGSEASVENIVWLVEKQRQSNDHVLLKMLEEGLHSDIILTARGGSVKAHRSVLSAVSPVFRAMFQHDMKEQLSSTVDIPDMTMEALQLFLLVLYTEAALPRLLRAGIDKHFDEFLKALLKYQVFMRQLHPLLGDAFKRNLTADNCWGYYDISLQFSYKSISSIVRQYIISNFHKVVQSAEFLLEMRRDPDRVYSILIEADQASHMMIKKLSVTKHGQSSKKRARQV